MQRQDLRFMRRALELARRGEGRVHPNPMVGALLVRRGRILAEGAHEFFGGPHAERNALKDIRSVPPDATLYVTLEPCDHFGKTPPCSVEMIRRGVRQVVVAMKDPNPLVAGRGLRRLKKSGVAVRVGVLEKEAKELNRYYIHWVQNKTPYVTAKIGQSLDGKIATRTGQSRWITGEASRKRAHQIRKSSDAVLVGVNTLLKDDPLLTVRLPGAKAQPLKVILDTSLKTPPGASIFSKRSPAQTLIFTSPRVSKHRIRQMEKKALVVVVPQTGSGMLDWRAILRSLGARGVTHLLIEGGGEVLGSAFSKKIVNEAYFFTSPRVIGGRAAVGSVGGEGVARLEHSVHFKRWDVEKIGTDILFHGFL